MNYKKKILCLTDYYLPGYQAGGPIRSIVNLVEHLGDEFEIYIICNDRDMLDKDCYSNVKIDSWNIVDKAKVFYASQKSLNIRSYRKILNKTNYDLLFLNSFFSPKFTILPLILRQFLLIKKKPCVICPRGNLSPEALKLKGFKKKTYIEFFKLLNLYRDLNWQASSEHEKIHIINQFGNKVKKVDVVPDFTPLPLKSLNEFKTIDKSKNFLKLLFLSRVSPMKNLDFLLRVLFKVNTQVQLSIFGPKEDQIYWKKCLDLINNLPANINVVIGEEVPQHQVFKIFQNHDLFISPTRGEAFGNAIIESLSFGLPVLISDKTLWKADDFGGLEVLELEEHLWVQKITKWSKYDDQMIKKKCEAALNYAKNDYKSNLALKKNKELFHFVSSNNLVNKY